jgi:hypothetical protein
MTGCRILDTLSTIMVAHSLYTYFVLNFGNLAADALVPWHVFFPATSL